MRLTRDPRRSPARQVALLLVIGGLSAALWFGWFAWDTEYQYNRSTGRTEGPYALWQGVGAFLCSIVVFWFAHRLLRFVVALLATSGCFTSAWITTAASTDGTGLWLVGAVLVGCGSTAGAAMMLGLAAAVDPATRDIDRSAPRGAP